MESWPNKERIKEFAQDTLRITQDKSLTIKLTRWALGTKAEDSIEKMRAFLESRPDVSNAEVEKKMAELYLYEVLDKTDDDDHALKGNSEP